MWIFGYGSLIWDNWEQAYGCVRKEEAKLCSFRRDFNKASAVRWGSSSQPCPTLGLEPAEDASCIGVAFEFPDQRFEEIMSYLQRREGGDFTFVEGIVRRSAGDDVRAYIPVNEKCGKTYIGDKSIAERVSMARNAEGKAGKCLDYVTNIRQELRRREIDDPFVEEFWRALSETP
jgi:glutathione-specific gamma-glutamylcyclotransferase